MVRILRRGFRVLAWTLGGLVVLVAALVLGLVIWQRLPFSLPEPTGCFPVGRATYDWVDGTRADPFAPDPSARRELPVWIWYPATVERAAKLAEYLPGPWAKERERGMGLGSLLARRYSSVHPHAVTEAPLLRSAQRFPILIFIPGLGPLASDYTILAEDLASHGYVVVAYTPTHSSSVVVFDDGRVERVSPAGTVAETDSLSVQQTKLNGIILKVWTDDVRFVMDKIEALGREGGGRFGGRLDRERIGVLGHSFGGATAAEVCRLDARCKAGANLDGYPYGEVTRLGLRQPFLFLNSEEPTCDSGCQDAARDRRTIIAGLPAARYERTIRGARHFNFSDLGLTILPMVGRQLGLLGAIEPKKALRVTADDVLEFFGKSLRRAAS